MSEMTITANVTITPQQMAEVFWNLGNDQQAEFFAALHGVITEDYKTNPQAYGLGEGQWHWLCKELRSPAYDKARDVLMAMSAPLYLHTLMYVEGGAS